MTCVPWGPKKKRKNFPILSRLFAHIKRCPFGRHVIVNAVGLTLRLITVWNLLDAIEYDYDLFFVNEKKHDMYLQIHSILSLPNQSGITTGAFYSNSASCFPYFPPSTTHHDVMHIFQETVSPSHVEHGKKNRNWGAQKIL